MKNETRTKSKAKAGMPQVQAQASISIASLEAVKAVAQAGSMSAAAQRLGRSQSAVSQLVSQAEEIFGCTLFDRSRRPFLATEAGVELLRHATRILTDLNALPQRMALRNKFPSLRIAMIDSFADTLGADLIRLTAVRGGDLFVSQGLTLAHVNDLIERRVDLVVSADSLDEFEGLSRYPILSENLVLLCPDRGFKYSPRSSLAELAKELPFIRYSSRSTTGVMIEKYLHTQRVPKSRRIEVDNADMMCTLVGQGVGWAITTPLHVLQSLQRMSGVSTYKLAAPAPARQVTLLTREGEFEEVAETLAEESRKLLTKKYIPELIACIPSLSTELNVTSGNTQSDRS